MGYGVGWIGKEIVSQVAGIWGFGYQLTKTYRDGCRRSLVGEAPII